MTEGNSEECYYSPVNETGLSNVQRNGFTVFPNPAKDILQVKGTKDKAEVSIFNIQGKEVLRKTISKNECLHVGDLPKVYQRKLVRLPISIQKQFYLWKQTI